MYKIIALIGEAGSGKDRIMKEVLAAEPDLFNEIISSTTRPMREGEVEGINYCYLTKEEFQNKAVAGQMLETAEFNGWLYGTSYDALSLDKPNIGIFNPAGIYSMLSRDDIDLTVFKICCSSKERLVRQLNRESKPDVQEIIRRFNTDQADFENLRFNYTPINNETTWFIPHAIGAILASVRDIEEQGQN
jgi:guanylate kinase